MHNSYNMQSNLPAVKTVIEALPSDGTKQFSVQMPKNNITFLTAGFIVNMVCLASCVRELHQDLGDNHVSKSMILMDFPHKIMTSGFLEKLQLWQGPSMEDNKVSEGRHHFLIPLNPHFLPGTLCSSWNSPTCYSTYLYPY